MDYIIKFHTLAAESGWNQPALLDYQWTIRETEGSSDTTGPDKRVAERDRQQVCLIFLRSEETSQRSATLPRSNVTAASSGDAPVVEKPMQIGETWLSTEERQRWLMEGCCIYCAHLGHLLLTAQFATKMHLVRLPFLQVPHSSRTDLASITLALLLPMILIFAVIVFYWTQVLMLILWTRLDLIS